MNTHSSLDVLGRDDRTRQRWLVWLAAAALAVAALVGVVSLMVADSAPGRSAPTVRLVGSEVWASTSGAVVETGVSDCAPEGAVVDGVCLYGVGPAAPDAWAKLDAADRARVAKLLPKGVTVNAPPSL